MYRTVKIFLVLFLTIFVSTSLFAKSRDLVLWGSGCYGDPAGDAGPAPADLSLTSGTIKALPFDEDSSEKLYFQGKVPADYEGEPTFFIIYVATNTSGDVSWTIKYTTGCIISGSGDQIDDPVWNAVAFSTSTVNSNAKEPMLAAKVGAQALAPYSIMRVYLARDPTETVDTYKGDAYVIYLGIRWYER